MASKIKINLSHRERKTSQHGQGLKHRPARERSETVTPQRNCHPTLRRGQTKTKEQFDCSTKTLETKSGEGKQAERVNKKEQQEINGIGGPTWVLRGSLQEF